MAIVVGDRVLETSTTSGTGTLTLAGAATGYQSFAVGVGVNNQTYYCIYDSTTQAWEVGIGTLLTGTTLSRTTVYANSAGTTALISFAANSKNVLCTYPAERSVDQSDVGTAPNQIPLNQYLGKLAFQDVVDTISSNPYYETAISDVEPTLNLDFTNSKTIDSRLNFSRSTTATYYDGKTMAMSEQNLLLQSQNFVASNWSTYQTTITPNTTVAPDGTITASTFLSANAAASVYQNISLLTGSSCTFSVWVKGAVGGETFRLSFKDTIEVSSTFTATTSWQRFTWTSTTAYGTDNRAIRDISNGSTIYTWGFQIENRSLATSYTPTTTTAVANYIPQLMTASINQPRLDYDPITRNPNGLLIEQASTNLAIQSQFVTSWSVPRMSIASNYVVAPDGTTTGAFLIEDTNNNSHYVYQNVPSGGTAAGYYTFSVYLKYAGRYAIVDLSNNISGGAYYYIDLTTGTITQPLAVSSSAWTLPTSTVTAVGNGWYRCSITALKDSTGVASPIIYTANTSSGTEAPAYTGTGYLGVYAWGAQVEFNAFASSYIPTQASQVTRALDFPSISSSSFLNIGQGTWYGNVSQCGANSGSKSILGSNLQNFIVYSNGTALTTTADGVNYANYSGTVPVNLPFKFAFTYSTAGVFACFNGNIIVSTVYSPTATTSFQYTTTIYPLGTASGANNNGWIRKLTYYPIAVSNSELQEITI